jgi:hypothetical protein
MKGKKIRQELIAVIAINNLSLLCTAACSARCSSVYQFVQQCKDYSITKVPVNERQQNLFIPKVRLVMQLSPCTDSIFGTKNQNFSREHPLEDALETILHNRFSPLLVDNGSLFSWSKAAVLHTTYANILIKS